jgi:hypothetical protein
MRSFALASIAALPVLAGCATVLPPAPDRIPARWIVVEKRMGELAPEGRVGDGQVDPDAVLLALVPLYPEDLQWNVIVDPHDYFVEVLEISPPGPATPGELVTARVRVGHAKGDEVYRLTAIPSRGEIHVLGRAEQVVRGGEAAQFQFTSVALGSGGIAVAVEKVVRGPEKAP